MSYEFSADHNKTMISVSTLALVIASLFIIGGLGSVIDAFVDVRSDDGLGTYAIVQITQAIIQIGIGILLIPAAQTLKKVGTTKGSDVKNMLLGITKMGNTFYLLAILLMITVVLGIIGIFNPEGLL